MHSTAFADQPLASVTGVRETKRRGIKWQTCGCVFCKFEKGTVQELCFKGLMTPSISLEFEGRPFSTCSCLLAIPIQQRLTGYQLSG